MGSRSATSPNALAAGQANITANKDRIAIVEISLVNFFFSYFIAAFYLSYIAAILPSDENPWADAMDQTNWRS